MLKDIYLTIDDAPSNKLTSKVDFLQANQIPAVFYCRGQFIPSHVGKVVNAIQKGFLIGNHSYSHPYFSQISLEACYKEIEKTEALIEACYHQAGVARPLKIFRFPFGDRGAGFDSTRTPLLLAHPKVQALQKFLTQQGFKPVSFNATDDFIDPLWDWDTEDYHHKLIHTPDKYKEGLQAFYESYEGPSALLLLHDFDFSHILFEITMEFLIKKGCRFLKPSPYPG